MDEGGALIDWKAIYEGATSQQRPFLFAGMILWLMFLFAFVGITASDFFCPNLSTIASRLGMSESVVSLSLLSRAPFIPRAAVAAVYSYNFSLLTRYIPSNVADRSLVVPLHSRRLA